MRIVIITHCFVRVNRARLTTGSERNTIITCWTWWVKVYRNMEMIQYWGSSKDLDTFFQVIRWVMFILFYLIDYWECSLNKVLLPAEVILKIPYCEMLICYVVSEIDLQTLKRYLMYTPKIALNRLG